MITKEWYKDIDEKYIRDKKRFVRSMEAKLDSDLVFRNRMEKAAEDDLEYLCQDVEKKHGAWYKLPCGHVKLISTGDFHKKVFTCYGCKVVAWEREAREAGIQFIQKVDGERALYKLNCNHNVVLSTSHVRTYKDRKRFCEECLNKELYIEAEQKGLEFIKRVDKNRKALYRFKKCGHEHILYMYHVRTEEVTCPTCDPILRKRFKTRNEKKPHNENLDEEQLDRSLLAQAGRKESKLKWKMEADRVGIIFLCRDKDNGAYGWYELPCKHIRRIQMKNVKVAKDVRNFHCPYCMEEARIKAAKEKGLTLLEIIDGDKAIYRFDKCGHIKEVYIGDIERHNKVICNDCVIDKWKSEAEKVNLTFLHKTEPKKALYNCQKCGTNQEFFVVAVRNNEFICKGCIEPK